MNNKRIIKRFDAPLGGSNIVGYELSPVEEYDTHTRVIDDPERVTDGTWWSVYLLVGQETELAHCIATVTEHDEQGRTPRQQVLDYVGELFGNPGPLRGPFTVSMRVVMEDPEHKHLAEMDVPLGTGEYPSPEEARLLLEDLARDPDIPDKLVPVCRESWNRWLRLHNHPASTDQW